MGCNDTVLPDRLLKNPSVKWITYAEDTQKPYNQKICLFRPLALLLHENERLEEETPNIFSLFLQKTGGTDPSNFWGVSIEDLAAVENIVPADIIWYGIDVVYSSMIGELATTSVGQYSITAQPLSNNTHTCYVCNINALLRACHCPSCDQVINRAGNLEQHLPTFKERVERVFPKNVYQLRGTLFDKLDWFIIPYADDRKLLTDMIVFDFESICSQEGTFRHADFTNWIGKHFPIYVSI